MDKVEKDEMVVTMTKAELRELIAEAVGSVNQSQEQTKAGKWYFGLKGVAELFGCGLNLAAEIKNSGKIDAAIVQISPKKFKVDGERATMLWKKHKDLVRQGVKA